VVVRSTSVGGGSGFRDGPGRVARMYSPTHIVWDTANERALVCDQHNNRIRVVTRSPPPSSSSGDRKAGVSDPEGWSAWTFSTLIGNGKRGTADFTGPLTAARLSSPLALVMDPVQPHILYITCQLSVIRAADGSPVVQEGAGAAPVVGPPGAGALNFLSFRLRSFAVMRRELWREGDALTLLLLDGKDVSVVGVPFATD
jgi:hypothetical protein